ncbi:hypothetical protein K8R43_02895 [archaeon]|nr:hypothetical protein [archaeon]
MNLNLLLKIPFWVFYLCLALYSGYSVLFPVETNFWIVTNGFPLIWFEFFSVIFSVGLITFVNKVSVEAFVRIKDYDIDHNILNNRSKGLALLGIATICALSLSVFAGIYFFVYFFFSGILKFIGFKSIRGNSELSENVLAIFLQYKSLILSLILGGVIFLLFSSSLVQQVGLTHEYHVNSLPENVNVEGDDEFILVMGLWVTVYYFIIILFELYFVLRQLKKDTLFVRFMDRLVSLVPPWGMLGK